MEEQDMGLACAALVLVSGLLVREHRLREK
jgi:hypothetical protein